MSIVDAAATDPPVPPDSFEQTLERAVLTALDGLLHALSLEPAGEDRFVVPAEPDRFDRLFGGQVVAQALLAASATITQKQPHSVHAYFVEAGAPGRPVELTVDRVRDGRSISTRRVSVTQGDSVLLIAMVSFNGGSDGPQLADPPLAVPPPEETPLLQDWARELPEEGRIRGRSWIERPPPLELRIGEPPNFLGGRSQWGQRAHWMRLPRAVGDDPLLHTALLAYASDYLLLDMIPRANKERSPDERWSGFSLDHSLWFHRPVRLDEWHLHTQQVQAISGHHGLVSGAIHDAEGRLVASVSQEGLVRPARR